MKTELTAYEQKFPKFIEACENKEAEAIIVAMPEALGDNYEEICESLRRMGNAGKHLIIAPEKKISTSRNSNNES